MPEQIVFPDGPRSELERTIEDLVQRAQAVLRTQGRLRQLLAANRRIVEHLDLEDTLRAVVAAAVELVGAEYGALGVIAPDEEELSRFIHVGMDEETVRRIGGLPRGHGLLGAVVRDRRPIRLDRIEDDARSSGFPEGHPPMHGFLGVPVRVRHIVYGNLYLANPRAGRFSEEDEQLVEALAATAGVAIDNARLFDEGRLRERWAQATADVTAALVADDSLEDVLAIIAERVLAFVPAALVCVIVPDGDGLRIAAASGPFAAEVHDQRFPAAGTLAGRAIATGAVVADHSGSGVGAFDWVPPLGPTVAIPLRFGGSTGGALVASRGRGDATFSEAELRMGDEFGRQISLAMTIAQGRRDRRRLELADDRSRIARDLHDHVIQRLFAAGLALQATAERAPEELRARIDEQVGAVDAAITEIRTAVFALGSADQHGRPSARDRLLEVVGELGAALSRAPRITFSGPIDVAITGRLARDVVAVVRESVANVARHAQGADCAVQVHVGDEVVRVTVRDDGPGVGSAERRSGTANLATRAAARRGRYELADRPDGGTIVIWEVPRDRHEGAAP